MVTWLSAEVLGSVPSTRAGQRVPLAVTCVRQLFLTVTKYPQTSIEKGCILAHGSRGFSSWFAGSIWDQEEAEHHGSQESQTQAERRVGTRCSLQEPPHWPAFSTPRTPTASHNAISSNPRVHSVRGSFHVQTITTRERIKYRGIRVTKEENELYPEN